MFFYGWVVFHCIYVPHFFNPSVNGHLVCFCVLAIVNSAAANIRVHVFFELWFSLDTWSEVGLLDHMRTLFLVFWRPSLLFSTVAAPIHIPTNSVGGFFFFHTLSSIGCLHTFGWWGRPSSFFLFYCTFNWRIITSQYCVWLMPYINMNQP